MDTFTLDRGAGTRVEINKFGATITSWMVNDVELIFVSPKAKLDGTKAIRGGVPICFPSFGPWSEGPQHGFARTSRWEVTSTKDMNDQDDMAVTLSLAETTAWDQKFELNYTVTLKQSSLELCLNTKNNNLESKAPFEFTTALHTYFKVPDVEKVSISGLKGLKYQDKTLEGIPTVTEERELVTLAGWTDRVYLGSSDQQVLNGVNGGKLIFKKTNLADTVVWNPWEKKAGEMSDLGSENWRDFVCVEAGQCVTPVRLEAGESWECRHELEYEKE
eukprot:GFUD01135479.1.p1 GENE.GFUD01135479.1~~GFUD01135479.1.p1  ORF type:complete len:275 (+),score=88.65 GFUD01135479.1:41-865(+)